MRSHRIYIANVADLDARGQRSGNAVHVINIDVQDNHEEATIGAFFICELCQIVSLQVWGGGGLLCSH